MKPYWSILIALSMLCTGCVTKYDDIVSDFHTIQNGDLCTTVAHDQRKFNAETKEPTAIECHCDNLKPTRRLVVKAGESPEVMACPVPMLVATKSSLVPSVQLHHARSLASDYVPAVANLLGLTTVGIGLSQMRIAQSVGGFSVNETFSTKYIGR